MSVFIVEDGTGLVDATSYVAVADADAYFADMPAALTTAWVALTLAEKQGLLMYATRSLDQRARWNGLKTVPTSALRWPRQGVIDCDELPVAEDVIPYQVQYAVLDIALWFTREGQNPHSVSDSHGLKSLGVDVIQITWQDGYNPSAELELPRGLNTILCGMGTLKYSGRSGFAPINKV